jgi:tetratricopeptide (TPR) repeat protein
MQRIFILILSAAVLLCSCVQNPLPFAKKNADFVEFERILRDTDIRDESRYTAINGIAQIYLAEKNYNALILFLTQLVEKNPDDMYNAYWLLMTAYAYLETGAEPFAEYYFERVIETCGDLLVGGNSVHFLCLQNLIRISTNHRNRISFFNQLASRFQSKVILTELYYRLAAEYEQVGEWDSALKSYVLFLEQPDAPVIQIAGIPDAYNHARRLIDFNNSSRDWTFASLEALATSVKAAISNYNDRALDRYRAKVGFFAMSWKQDETDPNSQVDFSMRSFMFGNRIRFNTELDASSNPNEAYLRTWGWSDYISVWYLYFRKVNFPVDPDIHGRWEWAGIYYGDMQ